MRLRRASGARPQSRCPAGRQATGRPTCPRRLPARRRRPGLSTTASGDAARTSPSSATGSSRPTIDPRRGRGRVITKDRLLSSSNRRDSRSSAPEVMHRPSARPWVTCPERRPLPVTPFPGATRPPPRPVGTSCGSPAVRWPTRCPARRYGRPSPSVRRPLSTTGYVAAPTPAASAAPRAPVSLASTTPISRNRPSANICDHTPLRAAPPERVTSPTEKLELRSSTCLRWLKTTPSSTARSRCARVCQPRSPMKEAPTDEPSECARPATPSRAGQRTR